MSDIVTANIPEIRRVNTFTVARCFMIMSELLRLEVDRSTSVSSSMMSSKRARAEVASAQFRVLYGQLRKGKRRLQG